MTPSRTANKARGERIRYVRERVLGFSSQEKLAKAIGNITRGAVGNWELGAEIGIKHLTAIAELSGASLEWLAYDRGEKPAPKGSKAAPIVASFDPDAPSDDEKHNEQSYSREFWTPKTAGAVPEIDVKLGAGEGAVGDVISLALGDDAFSGHRIVSEWQIPEAFLREARVSVKSTLIMEVVGDSMAPTYLPGDRVLVDQSQNTLIADTCYVITDRTSPPQIKRLQRVLFSDPVEVDIISDNPALKTRTVELDRLHIVGRVCGHIARR